MARPANNEGHSHAAFVETELAAPQTAAAAAPKARQRPVVAGEDYQCAFLKTQRRQALEQPAHLAVVFVEDSAELPLVGGATGIEAQPFLAGDPRSEESAGGKERRARR